MSQQVEFKPPNGYEYVLFLSFDLDVDSAEQYRGSDPVALSRGRFSVRRGVGKVLNVLYKYGLKTTFFVPGWVASTYPQIVKVLADDGHEIAAHGYIHERFDEFKDIYYEDQLFRRMIESIETFTNHKPIGFRAPYWRFSKNTLSLLFKHGFKYDSSLMDDEYPYIIEKNNYFLVELPVDWRLDDWPYLEYYRTLTPRELLDMWIDEIEYARQNHGYVSITMHPQCIGRGARINVLDKILRYAVETKAWIPQGRVLADYVLENLLGKQCC
ncbi:polysaccharide deacetylase [Staphylothermus marinus F1]|uniref:Polysaccharide deacetylase n=1 Tax=Staphylothermus marinus (strain ATCC 43588 / DSM 3639 / JCM 9404 / F1) TaxID=399550 RepID=A3DLH9_STAMF|nr:polysaccharide deacetylase [Staphylothermus marinus]ABN69489.1 polysaccharide deacetylase [Staphylothermus marinus F1]